MPSAIENMKRALETYQLRNRVYGDNYKHFGEVMMALYPNGLALSDENDWNRFGVIIQIVSKLTRYVSDPHKPHLDSIHDMGVYCFMLEELDSNLESYDDAIAECEEKEKQQRWCEHIFKEGRCLACDELDPNFVREARPVQTVRLPHPFNPIREGSDICKDCGNLEAMRNIHPAPQDPFAVAGGALIDGAFGVPSKHCTCNCHFLKDTCGDCCKEPKRI